MGTSTGSTLLKPTVADHERAKVRRWLLDRAEHAPDPGTVRDLAVFSLILDTAARPLEVERLDRQDLTGDLLRLGRFPQGRSVPKPEPAGRRTPEPYRTEAHRLSVATMAGLAAWWPVRQRLVDALDQPVEAVFVTLRGNWRRGSDGISVAYPAGLPLQARGVERAWERVVLRLAHQTGLVLPMRLEQLRRGPS